MRAARASGLCPLVSRPRAERLLVPFLLLNLAVLALVYASLLVPILHDGRYMPAWTDEYGYVLDARSFAANGTVHAARVKEESVARFGEAGTHGPGYIVLQGTIARLAGDPVETSLWPNLVALLVAFALVLVFPVPLAQRLAIVVLLLLHFAVLLYALTWMVETYQVLFAVAATLLLVSLYRTDRARDPGRFRRRLAAFVLVLLVLSLFRVTYALWALGLVPLARDRRELARLVLLAAAVVGVAVVATGLVSAPNPHWPLSRATRALAEGRLAEPLALLARNLGTNLRRYLAAGAEPAFYVVMKVVVVLLGGAALVQALRRGNRLLLAACLVLGAHLVLLLLLYDAHSWREHRHLAPAFYALVIALVVSGERLLCAALYVVELALLPGVYGYATERIVAERRWVAEQWAAHEEDLESLARIAHVVAGADVGPVTILHAKELYRNLSLVPLALPVRSADGRPIRYTGNLGATPDWRRFGRIPIHYVLAPAAERPRRGWVAVLADPNVVLYRVPRPFAGLGPRGTPRTRAGASQTRLRSSPSSSSKAARSASQARRASPPARGSASSSEPRPVTR